MKGTKVISFFSYKGGAGRSTLAFNILPILAKEHFRPTASSPMIIVDMDLDSCGISYLLNVSDKATEENCVQTILSEGIDMHTPQSISDHPFLKNLIPVGSALGYPVNEAILLLPALDNKSVNSKLKNNYADDGDNPFADTLKNFKKLCSKGYKVPAIILDSSVGNNATASASSQLADIIVCCMRPTTQFTDGTIRYLTDLESGTTSIDDGKDIVVVPNVIPYKAMAIDGSKYPDTARSKIQNAFDGFAGDSRFNYHLEMLDTEEFGVPQVDRFMWKESILYNLSELTENEQLALSRYHKLSGLIADICNPDD